MKFLQKLGKALMLPVACLPICGILMGIGYALCPATMQGGDITGILEQIGFFLVKAGGALIDHMAILFAIGVGVGMADDNDIAMLDNLINERAADGWELVTYDYMATSMQIKGAFVVTFRKEKDDIFTQSSTNLFETLDVRYSITDKKELENSNGFGNYSIRAEEDNSYVISIGDCRFITIRFNIEEAKGRLHGGCGAASMREYLENEAMAEETAPHLFAYIGNNRIDLEEDIYPSELTIRNTQMSGGSGEDAELIFELHIVFTRRGMDWDKTLTFTVPMHGEARYRFDYLTSTYDSKDGKVEKFTF